MKKHYLLLFALLCLTTGRSKATETGGQSVVTVRLNPDHILNRYDYNPVGLNLNYFIDHDEVGNRTRTLAETIRAMGVKFLRYPGGDKSDNNLFAVPPYNEACPHLSRKGKGTSMGRGAFLKNNESEFKDVPLNFDEFMELCRQTGCEPVIVVPCDSRKNKFPNATYISTREQLIEHAAEWVRYANKKHDYNIRYWMVGNESWHPGVLEEGYSAADYADDICDFSDAMKRVDPAIKIIPNVASDVEHFSKALFEKASGKFDLLCISNYPVRTFKNGYKDWVSGTHNLAFPFTGVVEQIDRYGTPWQKENLKIIVAEYGPFDWWDGWGFDGDMGHVMCNFDILGKLLQQPKMLFSCFWNTRWLLEPNQWPGFNALDNDNNFHPMAYSVAFWANYFYPEMIECSSGSSSVLSYSTYSRKENAAYVYLINQESVTQELLLEMKGHTLRKTTRMAAMEGTAPEDFAPRVFATPVSVAGERIEIAPYSISVYKVEF